MWGRLQKEITALEEENGEWRKEIVSTMNEERGKEEEATGLVSDGMRGAVTNKEMS